MSSSAIMQIDKDATESGNTLFITGSGDLTEVDIIKGSSSQSTSGSITGNSASVTVAVSKYNSIKSHAKKSERIKLVFDLTTGKHGNQVKSVKDVQCPPQAAPASIEHTLQEILALTQRQTELMEQKVRTDAELIRELHAISSNLKQLGEQLSPRGGAGVAPAEAEVDTSARRVSSFEELRGTGQAASSKAASDP